MPRYVEPDVVAEDEDRQAGRTRNSPSAAETATAGRHQLNRNDFRLMCANERLYEAYSELHGMCQGEEVSAATTLAKQQHPTTASILNSCPHMHNTGA